MARQQLRKDIEALKTQVAALESDSEIRGNMQTLLEDFERHLEEPEKQGDMVTRLQESVSRLETEHPILTGVLNNILNTLSSLGI